MRRCSFSPGFPFEDVCEVARRLESADILVPGFVPAPIGLYEPEAFLYASSVEEISHYILPDRNLVTRIASVAMGAEVNTTERMAAALMAFAQSLDINFEPSIAFHELAYSQGNPMALEELRWFRRADATNAHAWLDLALERTNRLVIASNDVTVETHDFSCPLRRWNRNYILALKVAELELGRSSGIEKACSLFHWMFSDFIIGGPAALFASFYFAPRAPRRGMLKHLRSANRELALAGVRNAAWDITYMSDFIQRVEETSDEPQRFLLATLDKGLRQIARILLDRVEREGSVVLSDALTGWWPRDEAERIAGEFFDFIGRRNDPNRRLWKNPESGSILGWIEQGETAVRSWTPATTKRRDILKLTKR